jgi:AcrR family transcriptional regulator
MHVKRMPERSYRKGNFHISLKLLWGRNEPSARGPRPGLTVERIVEAAIELADAEGLEAASMRRVAERLGVGAMSLYRYIPGKAELLDLMFDAVHAGDPPPSGDSWRARLEHLARDSRDRIQRHPWVLQVVVGQRPPLGPNVLANYDAYLDAVSNIGLTPAEMVAATELVGNYVQGATRLAVEIAQAEDVTGVSDEEWWSERQSFWEEYFDPERYAAISAVYEGGAYEDALDGFEFGLQRILDGIEALLAAR